MLPMNNETKQKLGKVLKEIREAKGWTQEKLEEKSGLSSRTIQRAENGEGLNKTSRELLAKSLGTTIPTLMDRIRTLSPEVRSQLRLISTSEDLIKALSAEGTKNIAPSDEHPFNEQFRDDLLQFLDDLDCNDPQTVSRTRSGLDAVLANSRRMGFMVFAGTYRESVAAQNGMIQKPTTVILATPQTDPRIQKSAKVLILDYLIDGRRGPIAQARAKSSTTYDWMRHQVLAKYDGEKRVAKFLKEQGHSPSEIRTTIERLLRDAGCEID